MNLFRYRGTLSVFNHAAAFNRSAKPVMNAGFAMCTFPRHLNVQYRSGVGHRARPPWRRHFGTSQPRQLHPLLWALVRPVAKFTAIFVGRGIRKWWHSLPKDKKVVVMSVLKRNKIKLTVLVSVLFGAGVLYYESHVLETPLTGRRRFVAFNEKQIQELADFQFELLNVEVADHLLPASHPVYRKVERLARKLIESNYDLSQIRGHSWSVAVIDDPIQNAFVLPNGKIFVYMGMVDACDNDDQLGVIIGHEMAHAVLGHGAETVSYTHLLEMLTIALVAAIWAVVPTDVISVLVHWLMKTSVSILLHFPFSRVLEVEADEIGLMMSAKACFDVRESVTFWKKMHLREEESGFKSSEWLSTHPNHDARSFSLEQLLPHMLLLREQCNCPNLPRRRTISAVIPELVPKRSELVLQKTPTTL